MDAAVLKEIESMGANAQRKAFDKRVRFVIKEDDSYVIDHEGGRLGSDEANVTITTDKKTFLGISDGSVNPALAYATGKVRVDGEVQLAMQLERYFSD